MEVYAILALLAGIAIVVGVVAYGRRNSRKTPPAGAANTDYPDLPRRRDEPNER